MLRLIPRSIRHGSPYQVWRVLAACLWIAALQACGPGTVDQTGPGEAVAGEPHSAESAYITPIIDLQPPKLAAGERLRVVATTSMVGDVVAQVGGEAIDLTVLLPPGADPHGFVATPRELATVVSAHLLLVSGFDLEEGLGGVLEQIAAEVPVVSISEGVAGRPMTDAADRHEGEQSVGAEPGAAEKQHEHGGIDPHVWFDPTIVVQWAGNAAAAMSALDPAEQQAFQSNADTYVRALQDLDAWIKQAVAGIPPARRVLVTDHLVFGYFAQRYGFEVVGAVIPAYSSSASPSPQDLANLLGAIEEHGVQAVFVGRTANADAAEALARDAGIQVVPLYTGSLGKAGGPASSYIAMMEYDVNAIVQALRGTATPVAVQPGSWTYNFDTRELSSAAA